MHAESETAKDIMIAELKAGGARIIKAKDAEIAAWKAEKTDHDDTIGQKNALLQKYRLTIKTMCSEHNELTAKWANFKDDRDHLTANCENFTANSAQLRGSIDKFESKLESMSEDRVARF